MASGYNNQNINKIRYGTRIAATLMVVGLIYALVMVKPAQFKQSEPFNDIAVEAVMHRKNVEIRPEIVKIIEQARNKEKTIAPNESNKQQNLTPAISSTNEPRESGLNQIPNENSKGETIITPQIAPNGGKEANGKNVPSISVQAEKTLFSLDCRKIDKDDRPKDCPPDNQAKQMVKAVQAPKYNPQNVTGFSNAETNAKKFAGWREPCENETGGKYQFCMPLGKKPPRVKTPIELCKEKGLENCKYPNLPDGSAPDSILTKGN